MSRQFVKASKKKLVELMERRFEDRDILAICMDGIIVDGRHILSAAISVESDTQKQFDGLVNGSSENAEAAKNLPNSQIKRGLATNRGYLFVIDDSKALRSVIKAVFGERAHVVQRCRTHKICDVTERLPKPTRQQIASGIRVAYKLPVDEGIVRLKTQATWLKVDHRDAAATLLEGLEETFAVNRLDPTPRLIRSRDDEPRSRIRTARYDASVLGSITIETPTWRCDGRPPAFWKPRSASENSAVPTRSPDARRRLASPGR